MDTFLLEQTELTRRQMEHLHEQKRHLRLRYFGDRLRIGLQLLGIVFGLAIAAALSAMVWQAHEDHGLVVEAFSVPPDLAQRGLTGQVLATRLLDRLAQMQTKTVSARPASTYANDWGGDIKVEFPETGVSIGELDRALRSWLGHETRITGEVVRTSVGLEFSARAGADPGPTFQGADADLDRLVQQGAEAVYARTQPYRYANYLIQNGRVDEGQAAFASLAEYGSEEDRVWAQVGWGVSLLFQKGQAAAALDKGDMAFRLNPDLVIAPELAATAAWMLRRDEVELVRLAQAEQLLKAGRALGVRADDPQRGLPVIEPTKAYLLANYQGAAAGLALLKRAPSLSGFASAFNLPAFRMWCLALDHDAAPVRRFLDETPRALASLVFQVDPSWARVALDEDIEDWAAAARDAEVEEAAVSLAEPLYADATRRHFWPERAYAYARLGRQGDADALIGLTPLDCDACLRTRGKIAGAAHDWAKADRWFAAAVRQAPSIPLAYADWGRSLLDRGDAVGAIAKLSQAHRKGPHFADPLEFWGEALMKKGDFADAVKKFREADTYAPRWGKNHLHWGEALMLWGRHAEARAQFEAADGIDLSKPDRAALKVLLARTASGPLHG